MNESTQQQLKVGDHVRRIDRTPPTARPYAIMTKGKIAGFNRGRALIRWEYDYGEVSSELPENLVAEPTPAD